MSSSSSSQPQQEGAAAAAASTNIAGAEGTMQNTNDDTDDAAKMDTSVSPQLPPAQSSLASSSSLDHNQHDPVVYNAAYNVLTNTQDAVFMAPLPTIVSMTAPTASRASRRRRRQRRRRQQQQQQQPQPFHRRPLPSLVTRNSSATSSTSHDGSSTETSAMADHDLTLTDAHHHDDDDDAYNVNVDDDDDDDDDEDDDDEEEEPPVTIVTPMRGHHALFRVLEEMEGLEKEEQSLLEQSPLTNHLTSLLTAPGGGGLTSPGNSSTSPSAMVGPAPAASAVSCVVCPPVGSSSSTASRPSKLLYESSRHAVESLREAGRAVPRRVCQHPFRKNDIVWVCRTCQADETCVLCHSCFSQSNHDGHDVAFYHAQAGGCCDCGDPDAWSPDGFCPHHGPQAAATASADDSSCLPRDLVHRVRGVVPAAVDWLVQEIATNAEAAFARAHPPPPPRKSSALSGMKRNSKRKMTSAMEGEAQESHVEVASSSAAVAAPMSPESEGEGMDVDEPQQQQQPAAGQLTAAVEAAAVDDEDTTTTDEFDDEVEDVTFPGMYPSVGNAAARNSFASGLASTGTVAMRAHVFSPMAASSTAAGGGGADRSLRSDLLTASLLQQQRDDESRAEEVGRIGAQGHGLYIVLHADDIHSASQLSDAVREFLGPNNFFTDTLLQKMIRSLRQYGQLIVWGTMETAAEVGMTNVHLWMDGDRVACSRVGAIVLERTSRLTKHGLFCGIMTRDQLVMEQRAVALLQWLSEVARSCDPLCQTVAECILPQRHLVPLLRADFKMSARVTKAWYSLLLTLLAVPTFKSHLAAAYCDTYRTVTAKYARGMGVMERSGYTLSVQFLNRVTYVVDLVQGRDLLGKLGKSLLETLLVARTDKAPSISSLGQFGSWGQRARQANADQGMMFLMRTATLQDGDGGGFNTNATGPPGGFLADPSSSAALTTAAGATARRAVAVRRLNPNHFVLTHRRYSPCISDLKCVLNVKGMPRLFACQGGSFLRDWVDTLSCAQLMDPQVWRHWMQGHVEDESRGWVGAFNASISLGSLFERLLGWEDEEPSPIKDPSSPLSRDLLSCSELTYYILSNGVFRWQRREMRLYEPTPNGSAVEPFRRCPSSLPYSTVAAKNGTSLAMRQLPVSQSTPFSFHLPLHRFVAGCFRELCLRKDDKLHGVVSLMDKLRSQLPVEDYEDLFLGLMEFPLVILTRAAQVRAGLWRRNGPGLNDQVLNYAEPPFCRTMRDADLLLIQLAVLGCVPYQQKSLSPRQRKHSDVGMALFVNLLLHRLGVFDFCGLTKAPNQNIEQYKEGIEQRQYPRERIPDDAPETEFTLPWTYSPARDTISSLVLLEEFLHAIIVFTSELPHVVPADQADHTRQARWRLHREVVHRLASGPKTHSELLEVHHVLSHHDNVLLSEEGKAINPDDATGAALGTVLDHIADRKTSRGKLEPDKWEMKRSAWDEYDPAFFHLSLRLHQTAADSRPKPTAESNSPLGWEPKAYAPAPAVAHPFFNRLRRDSTSDATVLAVVFRVLHMHLRENVTKDLTDMPGKAAYEKEKSETALARAVHLLTLGAFAWKDAAADDAQWRDRGGGSPGSVFADWATDLPAPVAGDWVSRVLLAKPSDMLDCDWYEDEENALVLIRRLASSGGVAGGFFAQDTSVRAGAAWICDFARRNSVKADSMFRPAKTTSQTADVDEKAESTLDARRRKAREMAMAKMAAQAAAFAEMMEVDIGEVEDSKGNLSEASSVAASSVPAPTQPLQAPGTPNRPIRAASFGSAHSTASSVLTINSDVASLPHMVNLAPGSAAATDDLPTIPERLLKERPRCIICNDEDTADSRAVDRTDGDDGEGQRKRSRRRTENALGFVGYIQPSTVLKGGGGPPSDLESSSSPVREFVGCHVALCGHAVHSECCESYLATVSHREDRAIGKRDEFRCPLCQRLSNCLVPFIDVAVDWISSPTCMPINITDQGELQGKSDSDTDPMQMDSPVDGASIVSLHDYLSSTPWWVSRNSSNIVWDGQSAFLDQHVVASVGNMADMSPSSRRHARRRVRPLSKKDLYAAWNAMMRTPRFVRRKLRPRSLPDVGSSRGGDDAAASVPEPEESAGETVVWRRFMDQVSDLSYRADSKRLGDDHLHDLFGEFRHYIVEKYAYNMANRFSGGEPAEWPYCVFRQSLSDQQRQEMSREKLLSKLLLSIQAFTYSCCCESFEARRTFRKSIMSASKAAGVRQELSAEAVFSRFGIDGIACDGRLVVMPKPSAKSDSGFQVFNGRLGKLRYLCLSVMAAAGAVAADLVQLVMSFPVTATGAMNDGSENPDRAPIAYPMLLGNVLTHVVAAMCASCGRGRARSDSLDLIWPAPFTTRGSFAVSTDSLCAKQTDSVIEDCEGFVKLGLLARMLQVLLGRMQVSPNGYADSRAVLTAVESFAGTLASREQTLENKWTRSCARLLEYALSNQAAATPAGKSTDSYIPSPDLIQTASFAAASAACDFLADAGTILQILVPAVMARYQNGSELPIGMGNQSNTTSLETFESLRFYFNLEPVDEMLDSDRAKEIVANWYDCAIRNSQVSFGRVDGAAVSSTTATLRGRLYRTQGFRENDWPSPGNVESGDAKMGPSKERDPGDKAESSEQPEDESTSMQVESIRSASNQTSTTDVVREKSSPALVTFSSKKTVPLLGGFVPDLQQLEARPRVAVMPTSYTDLYAELGTLLPECEQTAVCLICGEVLNAGGKGECTRHSYKCGAGAGMFFLLQECSGLIMHKSKAAYIHSPYVDSHGETPQYRGRPLNLDLDRYEHLREVWYGHSVRQQVVAERASSRQVILPDFY